ncbi:transcription activator effector-binding protein [Nocardioides flavus (ex Wang et al. 2016)]|uniref:Transcription activator effector-binding protein n=1 Tax=Nocardioides flavus (ex Wang et al. 2016) TaxID=2058780 RepID=A0ABQ3HK57_9ACTN|nr:GyrI-like domain-containing protein [Nocardioides flavus (ex Wang et al. 2016)]GHE18073.1 transcription activator effector-binding protein [Nocardioides flavus (ex Wang et al. 2016)]
MEHEITVVDLTEQSTAVVRSRASVDTIPEVLGRTFDAVARAVADQGGQITGPPFARYGAMDEAGWDLEAGFPIDSPLLPQGQVEPSSLPACRAVRLVHTGPYDTVGEAWSEATSWLDEHGYTATEAPWECYLDEPGVTRPRTLILMPCAARPESARR